jgi:hypothetical protein
MEAKVGLLCAEDDYSVRVCLLSSAGMAQIVYFALQEDKSYVAADI